MEVSTKENWNCIIRTNTTKSSNPRARKPSPKLKGHKITKKPKNQKIGQVSNSQLWVFWPKNQNFGQLSTSQPWVFQYFQFPSLLLYRYWLKKVCSLFFKRRKKKFKCDTHLCPKNKRFRYICTLNTHNKKIIKLFEQISIIFFIWLVIFGLHLNACKFHEFCHLIFDYYDKVYWCELNDRSKIFL